jgi:hypothetical protein
MAVGALVRLAGGPLGVLAAGAIGRYIGKSIKPSKA